MTPLQECYAIVTTAYGAGGIFYNGGHRGADYDRDAGEPIYAYDDFIIESIDYGEGLGWSVGVRRLNLGGYAGFAHIKNLQGKVGTRISKGAVLAYVAGYSDPHGRLWTGPHIHTTYGQTSAYFCSVGIRPLGNPVPSINASVFPPLPTTPVGEDSTPIDNDEPVNNYVPMEDIMLIHYTLDNTPTGKVGEYAVIGSGFAHKVSAGSIDAVNQIARNYTRNGESIWLQKGSYDKWVADSLAAK